MSNPPIDRHQTTVSSLSDTATELQAEQAQRTRRQRSLRFTAFFCGALMLSSAAALVSCKKDKVAKPVQPAPAKPSLRIYALAGAAGAVEPCGCVKDMLGGVDHAAAYINSQKSQAPHSLVLGAGPMFFENPTLEEEKKIQALFKAEAMAESLADLGLLAWAPGANDWADGMQGFSKLAKKTEAKALALNLSLASQDAASKEEANGSEDKANSPEQKANEVEAAWPLSSSFVVQRGGLKVGIVGVSLPDNPLNKLPFTSEATAAAFEKELSAVKKQGAELLVALIAAGRGEALRLVEKANAGPNKVQIAILGKAYDQGDNNEQSISPEIIDQTLVVQAPNHLQAVSVVDLYMRDGSTEFQDGTGLQAHQKRTSLELRIDELQRRIERWKSPQSKVDPKDIEAREKELHSLQQQAAAIKPAQPPQSGSYFLYDLVQVRENQGEDQSVASRLMAYYKKVNEHNKVAFADRKAPAVSEGEASYLGVNTCANCHLEEKAFWDTTSHAHAYKTLEVAHKEFNLDCVSCHVTGYEKPGGSTVTDVADFKSVQCEVCHGPGSLHVENPADKSLIRVSPSKSLCASACHHAPHVGADWSVDVAWPQIIGKGHGM